MRWSAVIIILAGLLLLTLGGKGTQTNVFQGLKGTLVHATPATGGESNSSLLSNIVTQANMFGMHPVMFTRQMQLSPGGLHGI